KGTRLSVEFILELIAEGWSEADMLRNYPGLTREQILACVAYAKDRLSDEKLLAIPAWTTPAAMRLCANENVPGDCVAVLRQRGHDVLWVREVARGSGDDAVLAK